MNAFAELEKVLDPKAPIFTSEGARRLVGMSPDPETLERMETLAEKTEDGTQSAEEQREYEELVCASKLMSILRLKAGAFLANSKAA